MNSRLFLTLTAILGLLIPVALVAQPMPKQGTKMVPNEYGGEFPAEIVWKKDGSEMVLIPHGTFRMGLDPSRGGTRAEGPAHQVTLPSFYIDKYEISNAQYEAYYREQPSARPRPTNKGLTGPELPVTAIPWFAAQGYAEWVGRQLPTEAMWEKAARGAEGNHYTTGNAPPSRDTVHHGRSGDSLTVPVDKDAGDVSVYGVHHMGGNVSEWVGDWYSSYTYQDRDGVEHPTGPEKGEAKSIRGGSFTTDPDELRITKRSSHPASLLLEDVGFRTAWIPRPVVKATPSPSPVPTDRLATDDEVFATLIEKITPYMQSGEELPRDLLAGDAFRYTGEDEISVANMTPFEVTISFLSADDDYAYAHNVAVQSLSFQKVKLTKGKDLFLLAYSAQAQQPGPYIIGNLRAESKPLVIIPTEFFSRVVDESGTDIDPGSRTATQYYDTFRPQWNEFEVMNNTNLPITVAIATGAPGSKPEDSEHVRDLTIEGGEIVRLTLDPDFYQFRPNYIGARSEGGRMHQIRLDEKAARRLLVVTQDKSSDDEVVVITQKQPFLKIVEKAAVRR